eukprot:c18156_g1_i2.p1 GENE.c18156_g1_i2~~c18156_g1_i2.p1  ORF type:complete len:277 (+),score=39.74 c18156_g1_i2:29-859(+)
MSVEQLNLEVLRRRDPEVAEIVSTAAHVAVYEYAIRDRKWDRRGVEGSLFVTRRKCAPFYRFVVMNRLGPENQTEDIVPGFEVELNHDFVLYRTHENRVRGLWFYEPSERQRVLTLLTDIIKQVREESSSPGPSPPTHSSEVPNLAFQRAVLTGGPPTNTVPPHSAIAGRELLRILQSPQTQPQESPSGNSTINNANDDSETDALANAIAAALRTALKREGAAPATRLETGLLTPSQVGDKAHARGPLREDEVRDALLNMALDSATIKSLCAAFNG